MSNCCNNSELRTACFSKEKAGSFCVVIPGWRLWTPHSARVPEGCGYCADSSRFVWDTFLDHLTADAACFPGGQVAVVVVGQVGANFPDCQYLDLVRGFLSLEH